LSNAFFRFVAIAPQGFQACLNAATKFEDEESISLVIFGWGYRVRSKAQTWRR
jgi:hypothetical protein